MSFRCQDLQLTRDGRALLSRVSLSAPDASVTAIVGSNGAGKSTFMNAVTGVIRPDSGSCFIGGIETTGLPLHRMLGYGVARTFQETRLADYASALDNVLISSEHIQSRRLLRSILKGPDSKIIREQAKEYLAGFGLATEGDRLAGTLSFGQRKLLSLACCLSTGARTIFLDEPVAGVHVSLRPLIAETLARFRAGGAAILLIEHDLGFVSAAADRVYRFERGRAEESSMS